MTPQTDREKTTFRLNTLAMEIREYLEEDFDCECICVEDFELTTSGSTPITHITAHSSHGNDYIGLWCGDPDEDKHAEELIVSDEEYADLYRDILNYL